MTARKSKPARKIDGETNPVRMALMRRWGEAIADARLAFGLTKAEAAEWLGVPRSTLHAWEMGRRACTLAMRRRIVEELDGDPNELDTTEEICPYCGKPTIVESHSTRPKHRKPAGQSGAAQARRTGRGR